MSVSQDTDMRRRDMETQTRTKTRPTSAETDPRLRHEQPCLETRRVSPDSITAICVNQLAQMFSFCAEYWIL